MRSIKNNGFAQVFLILAIVAFAAFALVFASKLPALQSIVFPQASNSVPTIDLKVNGVDGPLTVNAGSTLSLVWAGVNVTSCTASGNWSGSKATSGVTTVPSVNSGSYILSCVGPGGETSDSVNVVNIEASYDTTRCWERTTIIKNKYYWADACKGTSSLYNISGGKAICSISTRSTMPTFRAVTYPLSSTELADRSEWVADGKPLTPCQQ